MTFTRRKIAGRETNPIGLGCMSLSWAYGTPPSDEDGARVLDRALDLGYDHLDTARIYGLGHNETLIGQTLAGKRNRFFLASKTGIIVDGKERRIDCKPETIRTALETSLQLLKTDHIDLYYLHRRDFSVPIEESVGALADLVREGKIGGIGLSEMSSETVRRAHAEHPIAALQTEYSPMTRNPEISVLETCRELGITFVAFSPVGRGILVDAVPDPAAMPKGDIRPGMPRFQGENWTRNLALVQAFAALAAREGVTAAQLALGWVLAKGEHIVAIPGTGRIDHLEENIARWDWEPSAALVGQVDALINRQTVAGHRYGLVMQSTIDTEEFADVSV
jgi:aryl-alcohol dehydrogenase-like predicted oxidoreductase